MMIERKEIILTKVQAKMLSSGWGKEVYDKTTVEEITYYSDGLKVKGYLAYPKDTIKNKYPCIIWNRGGYFDNGSINRFNACGMYGQIALWGYVVFASQYRGNAGGEGKDEIGGSDVNDVLNLIPLAEELPFADKDNWGMEGWSRGGMMTLLALKMNSSFKCAILIGAITDMEDFINSNEKIKYYYNNHYGKEELNKILSDRSALRFINDLPDIPYLILHGKKDHTVSPMQSALLAKGLKERGIEHNLVLFDDGDHYLKRNRAIVNKLRQEWFDRYLKIV